MEEGRPSSTALGAALLRAAHLVVDDEPSILKDDFAAVFSGVENEAALRAALERMQANFIRRASPALAHSGAASAPRSRGIGTLKMNSAKPGSRDQST
jgi:hypothetical protein